MLEDIIGEIWIVIGLIIITIGKIVIDKYKSKKNNNPNPIIDRRQHCTEHPKLMTTITNVQIDMAEVKTDIKWIRRNLNNGRGK